MVEIRQILYPVDFSESSRRALEHAVAIARWYQAGITALHVMPIPETQPPILMAGVVDPQVPAPSGQRHNLEEQLRTWLEPAHQAGINTNVTIDEGSAAGRILAQVTSTHADLVVMGTHGLGGFDRLLLGSVTEKVLRKATCPVLTVPPTTAAAPKVPYSRLLCPVDFSESSLAALRFACSLAKEANAALTVLHVFDWPEREPPQVMQFEAQQILRTIEDDATRRLEALVSDETKTWCTASTQVVHGKPYRGILDTAEREGTDLIVIGVRGRNPIDLTLFGSTTNHVVRRAVCPVLTIRQ